MTRCFLCLAGSGNCDCPFLDIDRLFVQQLKMVLDCAAILSLQLPSRRVKEKLKMNRIRVFAIATIFMFALTAIAQQAATSADGPNKSASGGEHAGVPTAEGQLKVLTAKLDLTGDQQERVKPILQELHDATVKLAQDESMSHEERLSKVRDSRYTADKKIRAILNDDQKKKLDRVEQGPHPELHGDLSGARN
jgi:Spy/CpxP family protein refolding chaperone